MLVVSYGAIGSSVLAAVQMLKLKLVQLPLWVRVMERAVGTARS